MLMIFYLNNYIKMIDKYSKLKWLKVNNKKHTASRKKAGMRLNNRANRSDLCNLYVPKKQSNVLSPTL